MRQCGEIVIDDGGDVERVGAERALNVQLDRRPAIVQPPGIVGIEAIVDRGNVAEQNPFAGGARAYLQPAQGIDVGCRAKTADLGVFRARLGGTCRQILDPRANDARDVGQGQIKTAERFGGDADMDFLVAAARRCRSCRRRRREVLPGYVCRSVSASLPGKGR